MAASMYTSRGPLEQESDIHIAAYAPSGKIVVYEFDPSTNIEASIGEFLISTADSIVF